jgi:hypothetical protein
MQMFGELHAGGATICLVTHDPRWLTQCSGTSICSTDGWWTRRPPRTWTGARHISRDRCRTLRTSCERPVVAEET